MLKTKVYFLIKNFNSTNQKIKITFKNCALSMRKIKKNNLPLGLTLTI